MTSLSKMLLAALPLCLFIFLTGYGAAHLLFIEHPKYCFDEIVNPLTGE